MFDKNKIISISILNWILIIIYYIIFFCIIAIVPILVTKFLCLSLALDFGPFVDESLFCKFNYHQNILE